GIVVAMRRGKVDVEVAPRGERPPLIVRAGDTDVIVVGTHFAVDYGDGSGEVDVRVYKGAVRVVHQQQETRVAAGQGWTIRTGLVATSDRNRIAPPSSATHGDGGSTMRAGDTAIAIGPMPDVLHDRKAAVPDAPAVSTAPPARGAPAPVRPPGGQATRA